MNKKDKLYFMDDKKAKILEYLETKYPVVLHGETGVGKTAMAFEIAREQGWKLIRVNSSMSRTKDELEEYYRLIRTKSKKFSFGKKKIGVLLFLFDEIDGFYDWQYLQTMLMNAQHPVILTANDWWKVPQWPFKNPKTKKSIVKTMKFYPPNQEQIVAILRKKGVDGNFTGITRDVRAAEKVIEFGSVAVSERNQFDQTKYLILNPQEIVKFVDTIGKSQFNTKWMNWISHNIPIFHRGFAMFEAMELISMASVYNDPKMLQFIREVPLGGKGQKSEYPEYLKTLKKYKRGKKKNVA